MPILENQRHELFAQALAAGKSATEAYVDAGYEDNRHNAARMSTNEHIAARVAELQGAAAIETVVTIVSLTNELEAARVLAMESPRGASAAVAATMGKAKLHGLLIDRTDNVNHVYSLSDEPLTEDEWIATYATEH